MRIRWTVSLCVLAFTVRVRRALGPLERPERGVDQILFYSDYDPECSDLSRPRPYASHPRPSRLRSVARPRDEECRCGFGNVEALRCPEDAVLSRKHADQPCG
jgi:hypothetical protein